MYSISAKNNSIKVYYNNRLKFVCYDLNKALHFISVSNYRRL